MVPGFTDTLGYLDIWNGVLRRVSTPNLRILLLESDLVPAHKSSNPPPDYGPPAKYHPHTLNPSQEGGEGLATHGSD